MTPFEQEAAANSCRAHFDARIDHALAQLAGPGRLFPRFALQDGGAILRRWRGRQYARPAYPLGVGFALRPCSSVTDNSLSGPLSSVCWHVIDLVNGGGLMCESPTATAQPAAYDGAGAHVGLLPSPPLHVQRHVIDGGISLLWYYSGVRQQTQPHHFNIYTDEGGGTISETPYATVAYVPARGWFSYTKSGSIRGWKWLVLAATEAEVVSLTPMPAGRGLSEAYGVDQAAAILGDATPSRSFEERPTPTMV